MATYLQDSDGKFIPATQRPDGTWRKARRVKEGYVPQEEVPLYESKGKQFAQRKTGLPPGMCPQVVEAARKEREKQERAKAKKEAAAIAKQNAQKIPGVIILPTVAAANKNVTKSSKVSSNNINSTVPHAVDKNNEVINGLASELETNLTVQDETQELMKKLKKLRKKLREIEAIEEKIKSGELKKPEKDQLDKVKRKKEIKKELKQLEEEAAYFETNDSEK